MLGAIEKGLGGCILTSVDRDALRGAFTIPFHLEILLVIALGKPAERVIVEDLEAEKSIKYYRTPDGVHHVPKRGIEDIIFAAGGQVENPGAAPK